jgi:hypothetical protein
MLRHKFLGYLGGLAGAVYFIAFVYKAMTGESFSQGVGTSFSRAPEFQETGAPGRVVSSFFRVTRWNPQGVEGGVKRYDVVYYRKGSRIDLAGCNISIVGPTAGDGDKEITWAPISVVVGGKMPICYAPRGPIEIGTGAKVIPWRNSFAKVLKGDPAFATATLSADAVKKNFGSPELEIIDGSYDQKNRPNRCLFPKCWVYHLKKQVDIYSFSNRSGLLKITYDGSGESTKIENALEKK